MALDSSKLTQDIIDAMAKHMPDMEPATREFAADLAAAIDTHVRSAEVQNVHVLVGNQTFNQIGSGTLQ